MELEDALTARRTIDKVYNEARRQYNAVPKRPMREVPVPNCPNIEIPVGAILSDDIYAQATDTLFTASPLLTVRPVSPKWVEHAKACQDWVNWLVSNEVDLRNAANHAIVDDCQLGTGVYYIPFVESTKKDKVFKIIDRRPRMFCIAPEDWIVPPGSRGNVQLDRWVSLRFWYTKGEMEERAKERGWDIANAIPVAQFDLVRLQHERKANMRGAMLWREVYEVHEVYCYYDYDGDGIDEDLLVTYDRASRTILSVQFNPYDIRPIEVMRYQLRSHLPYGIGIMEMVQPFQEEVTEIHVYTMLNIFLCNARVWVTKEGVLPDTFEITPGKICKVQAEDVRTAFQAIAMADVYPSAFQAQASAMQLAERRVGTSGSAGIMAKGGSRTPGVTALSLLQQVNRRFAPAFADMREATGRAVVQCIMRYRERVLAKDKQIINHITSVVGEENSYLLQDLLTSEDFDKCVSVEFTASTATVNREADRQSAIMVAQTLNTYYQQIAALAMQASQQAQAPAVQQLLIDVARKGTELMERTLRTFDNVRDPKSFLVDMTKLEEAVQEGAQAAQQAAMQQQQMQQQQQDHEQGMDQVGAITDVAKAYHQLNPPAPGVANAPVGGKSEE